VRYTIERKLPDLSKDLIDALDERFPVRMADPKDSEREIWIKVGQRFVVDFLKDVYEEQHTTLISTKE
jgi:hypothetical protein|tara:strand:+ start:4371 stop:4574 length:204 start_codon:yes stop_codon:yes gene_type:complete